MKANVLQLKDSRETHTHFGCIFSEARVYKTEFNFFLDELGLNMRAFFVSTLLLCVYLNKVRTSGCQSKIQMAFQH